MYPPFQGLNKLSALEPAEPYGVMNVSIRASSSISISKTQAVGYLGHRITGRYPGAVNRHHGIGWGVRSCLHR